MSVRKVRTFVTLVFQKYARVKFIYYKTVNRWQTCNLPLSVLQRCGYFAILTRVQATLQVGKNVLAFDRLEDRNTWRDESSCQLADTYKDKGKKGKLRPRIGEESTESGGVVVQMYSFFNLGARWGGWLATRPGHFIPGNEPVSIVQEAGWVLQPVWTNAENFAPHRDSIPGSSSQQRIAIPTELSRPRQRHKNLIVFAI